MTLCGGGMDISWNCTMIYNFLFTVNKVYERDDDDDYFQ